MKVLAYTRFAGDWKQVREMQSESSSEGEQIVFDTERNGQIHPRAFD